MGGPSLVAATTTSLVRGGVRNGNGNGDAGQEDLSSTSVGDNSIESNTNSFVEEEEEGGLLGDDCRKSSCLSHSGDAHGCQVQEGCYWYQHFLQGGFQDGTGGIGSCLSCSGVSCGMVCLGVNWCFLHRAPVCSMCPKYDGEWKEKGHCKGECNWQVDIDGVGSCGPKAHTYCDSTVTHPHHEYCPSGKKCPNCGSKRCVCPV